MTIDQIKEKTKETSPYFFSPSTLNFFGQTLDDFKVIEQEDGRFLIQAPIIDHRGERMGETKRFFNPLNNKLERE